MSSTVGVGGVTGPGFEATIRLFVNCPPLMIGAPMVPPSFEDSGVWLSSLRSLVLPIPLCVVCWVSPSVGGLPRVGTGWMWVP